MEKQVKIKSALVSVYHKDGLDDIIKSLNALGVTFYSTGGTQAFIEELGFKVVPVEDLTSYPSILGGRVKTLHPKVFGGILARRENHGDQKQLAEYQIPEIDLVIVDLYPFEATVASGASSQDIIEKIDIGGISLISIYFITNPYLLIVPMIGVGIAWTSILAMPYAILAGALPARKMGLYMGVFNFFITLPQIVNGIIGGPVVKHLYGSQAIFSLVAAGVFFLLAAFFVRFVDDADDAPHGISG